jgi:hypothetical protein
MMKAVTLTDEELAARIRLGFERYEPRSETSLPVISPRGGRNRVLALLALPAALVVALIATQIGAPPSAFASWNAVPTAPDPALVSAVIASCHEPVASDASADERAYQETLRSLPQVAVDQRGTAAAVLFAERQAQGLAVMVCLGAANGSGTITTAGSGGAIGVRETPASGPLHLFGTTSIWSSGGIALTTAEGSVEPGVDKVVVSRGSGGDVTATIEGEFWVAWWPGDAKMVAASAIAADGSEMARIKP